MTDPAYAEGTTLVALDLPKLDALATNPSGTMLAGILRSTLYPYAQIGLWVGTRGADGQYTELGQASIPRDTSRDNAGSRWLGWLDDSTMVMSTQEAGGVFRLQFATVGSDGLITTQLVDAFPSPWALNWVFMDFWNEGSTWWIPVGAINGATYENRLLLVSFTLIGGVVSNVTCDTTSFTGIRSTMAGFTPAGNLLVNADGVSGWRVLDRAGASVGSSWAMADDSLVTPAGNGTSWAANQYSSLLWWAFSGDTVFIPLSEDSGASRLEIAAVNTLTGSFTTYDLSADAPRAGAAYGGAVLYAARYADQVVLFWSFYEGSGEHLYAVTVKTSGGIPTVDSIVDVTPNDWAGHPEMDVDVFHDARTYWLQDGAPAAVLHTRVSGSATRDHDYFAYPIPAPPAPAFVDDGVRRIFS